MEYFFKMHERCILSMIQPSSKNQHRECRNYYYRKGADDMLPQF